MNTSKKALKSGEITTSVASENELKNVGTHNANVSESSSAASDIIPKKVSTEPDAVVKNPSAYAGIISEEFTEETGATTTAINPVNITVEIVAANTSIIPVKLTVETGSTKTGIILKDQNVEISSVPKASSAEVAATSKEPSIKITTISKKSSTEVADNSKKTSARVDIVSNEFAEVGAGVKDTSVQYGIIQTETLEEAGTALKVTSAKDMAILKRVPSEADSLLKYPSEELSTSLKLPPAGVATGSKEEYADPIIVSKEPTAGSGTMADESSAQNSDPALKPPSPITTADLEVAGLKYAFLSTCQKISESLGRIMGNSSPQNKSSSETNIPEQRSLPSKESDTIVCKSKYKSEKDIPLTTITPQCTQGGNRENSSWQAEYNIPEDTNSLTYVLLNPVPKRVFPLNSTASSLNTRNKSDSDNLLLQSDNQPLEILELPTMISPPSSSDSANLTDACTLEYESSKEEKLSGTLSLIHDDTNSLQSGCEDTQQLDVISSPHSCHGDDNISGQTESLPHDNLKSSTVEFEVPPLFGWIPPTAKRIRPPVAESHLPCGSDTDTDSFQSDSESRQYAPVVSPLFHSDSDSATDICSLHSEFESPEDSPRRTSLQHLLESMSKKFHSAVGGSNEMETPDKVGTGMMVTNSKYSNILKESNSKADASQEPYMELGVKSKLPSTGANAGRKEMPSKPNVVSKEPNGRPAPNLDKPLYEDFQGIPVVSTPYNTEIDKTNLSPSENESREVAQSSSGISLPYNKAMAIDKDAIQLEYEEFENATSSPLLVWQPLLKPWVPPRARRVRPTEEITPPAAIESIINSDVTPDSDSSE